MRPTLGRFNKSRGFTLIELLVVVAIISVLVSILLPSLRSASDLARQVQCSANLRGLSTSMFFYLNDNNALYNQPGTPSPNDPTSYGTDRQFFNRSLHRYTPWYEVSNWIPTAAWVCPVTLASPDVGRSKGNPYCQSMGFRLGRMSGDAHEGNAKGLPSVRESEIPDPSKKLLALDATGDGLWNTDPRWGWGAHRTEVAHEIWLKSYSMTPTPHYIHNDRANAVMADGHCESFDEDELSDLSLWLPRP